MFTHFDLVCLKDRALLGPSQPHEATGTHAWLNLRAKYSWAWLAGDCLAVEALHNCVTELKSSAKCESTGREWEETLWFHSSPYRLTLWHNSKLISKQTWRRLTPMR